MPIPQLTLPEGLPCFLLAGHAIEQSSQYAHPRFQTGHSRARRVWTASEKIAYASLLLEADEAAAFRDWHEGALQDANGLFSAHVANDEDDGSDQLWYRAEFEAPPTYDAMPLGRWRISAKLRLTGAGQAEGPYTGELGYSVRVPLVGSVAGTVVPTLGYSVSAPLQQQLWLGYSVSAALEQPLPDEGGGGGDATWSPTDKTAGWSLSGGDLTASEASGSVETIRATDGATSGKTYWEVIVNVSSSGSIAVGVREAGDSITEDLALGVTASIRGNSQLFTSGGFSADGLSGFAYAGPAILMFAADHPAGYLYVGLNGAWRNGGDPAAGTGGRLVMPAGTHKPYLRADNDGTNNSATLVADPADWAYAAPSGFGPL